MLDDLEDTLHRVTELGTRSKLVLGTDEILAGLRTVRHLTQATELLQIQFAHAADLLALPAADKYRALAPWLEEVLQMDRGQARELAKNAQTLGPDEERLILDGRASIRQVRTILDIVKTLPDTLGELHDVSLADITRITRAAEDFLLDHAHQFNPVKLRLLGDRILHHVAPDLADRADEIALKRQDARARPRRGLTLGQLTNGLSRISGYLGADDLAAVQAALDPLCQPLADDDRTPAQRRADALVELCRMELRSTDLPVDGGEPAQVSVTVPYDVLTQTLGTAVTDTGIKVSAETVRRMACDAKITPIVLGTEGQILDVGRARRLASGPIRRALVVRDGGCAWPGCTRPARWCDAHHVEHWNDGGPTSLGNMVLLCGYHHRLIHDDSGWVIRFAADGRPDFIPPVGIDPLQRPRRNVLHTRE